MTDDAGSRRAGVTDHKEKTMRVQKLSLAAVALAAGLSLTACSGGDDASASSKDSSAASSSSSSDSDQAGGNRASEETSTESGEDTAAASKTMTAAGSATCKTSQLAMSVSGGMGEGDRLVNLKNTGDSTCTIKGFPGVDLKIDSEPGGISAERSDLDAPAVKVKPGAETRFTLHTPRNDTGGSGVDVTRMVVTPPNETHSKTLPVRINLPVSDEATSEVRVDPVGTGK